MGDGIEVDAVDSYGETPLFYAVDIGIPNRFASTAELSPTKRTIILLLLAHGADIDHVDNYGDTVIMRAGKRAETGRTKNFLMKAGGYEVTTDAPSPKNGKQ